MRKIRNIISSLFIFIGLFLISSCSGRLEVKNLDTIHEMEFGGIYLTITIDDFNNKGFNYGDSVDIEFTNGYKVNDIPYYNGYYVDAGETLLVGYPGYDYVKLTLNYGDDYWDIADLKDGDKGSIKLNQALKYKDIQDTMNIQYSDTKRDDETEAEFSNYRMVNIGNIKDNILYRGASPCDNKHNRASHVDSLLALNQINYVVNLADTPEKIQDYMAKSDFNSPYFKSLYERNTVLLAAPISKVLPLSMNMNYKSDEFREKVALGLKSMLSFQGPYYIHCQEGKDRTGFVLIVIEALLGASYQEMVDDYMETYKNYYNITLESDSLRYNIIKQRNVDAMLKFLIGNENANLSETEFSSYIRLYLINGGMTDSEVTSFINLLS
ncbi:MAG: tyrosine-protein phosphatase [Acholeplasmatales bacterium]|nr:tyrosine-protein phosphatase [Acholeplasmatales bacterium]